MRLYSPIFRWGHFNPLLPSWDVQLSEETSRSISILNAYAGGRLLRADDLALLLELSRRNSTLDDFDRLTFLAKFASNAHRIMQRIGTSGEGYDKLAREFGSSIEEVTALVQRLIHSAPEEDKRRLASSYLQLSVNALDELLSLLSDLSWYKNWKIDHPDQKPWDVP